MSFADNATRLRERGWLSLLPLHNPGKRPIPAVWQQFNTAPPTDAEISRWVSQYPGAGIGFAVGPDRVLGVDLDFLDPAKADTARTIALEHFPPTPLIRVGLAPKTMLLYRHAGGMPSTRRLGGVELFTTSGQFVFFSIHPDTLKPYHWPVESPLDVSPAELPLVTPAALSAFISAIAPYCQRPAAAAAQAHGGTSGNGRAAELLRAFSTAPDIAPAQIAAAAVTAAGYGDRHHTMVAAVVALTEAGLADAAIHDALFDSYIGHFTTDEVNQRIDVFLSAMRWARRRVGSSTADLPPDILAIADALQQDCGW